MNHRSLAFRLGAWYTLLLGLAFIVVGAATFFGLQEYLHASLRDSLRRRSTQVEEILLRSPPDTGDGAIAREIETRVSPEFNNRFIRVTRLPQTTVFRSGAPTDHSFDPESVSSRVFPADPAARTQIDRAMRLMIRETPVHTESGDYVVELGVSIGSIDEALDRLLDLLALLLPGLLLCSAAGGYWLVNRALRPVDHLSQTAEQMSLQNLASRLPVAPTGDALERLSISLNGMLSRLRDSVQTSRRFLADASHELRTPLTVIKGELQELAHVTQIREEEMRERVGSVLEEVARLEHLVSGLLVLSRLDAGETQPTRVEVNLAELAMSTAEQMRLIADDRGVALDLTALRPATVRGDPGKLKQVIVNLLDNAIRFTPRGGSVSLQTLADDSGSMLEISDSGIGIPTEALPFVFDRFYRVDQARSREDGGAGLGLSIVKSICAVHGAEIDVRSESAKGSSFRVRFPRRLEGGGFSVSGEAVTDVPPTPTIGALARPGRSESAALSSGH